MSNSLSNSTSGLNLPVSTNDSIPTRSGSDNFSSSHSYVAEYHAQNNFLTQRRICEQLRQDAKRERIKVSIACQDLIRYIIDHQSIDPLVMGFPSVKDNPYREKQQCSLI